MAEYVDKEAVTRAAKYAAMFFETDSKYMLEAAGARIVAMAVQQVMPVDDVEKVVHCDDCKYYTAAGKAASGECEYWGLMGTYYDGFCSNGSRR